LTAGRHVEDLGLTKRHTITNKVEVNLDVLRPLMLNWVGGHVHGAVVRVGGW
jgi:hypothetical protein